MTPTINPAGMLAILDSHAACFTPPDRRPIYEWASDNIRLPKRLSKPGGFSVADTRHLIAPFVALQDDHVREVNIKAPVRGGKTLIADVWLPWVVVNDPGPFLWIFQKDPTAKSHAKERALPTMKSCASVRALLPGGHAETLQEITFRNGMTFCIQGPALSNLQSKGFRYVVFDEPWLIDVPGNDSGYSKGAIEEGRARLGDFVKLQTDKLLCISQGGHVTSNGVGEWEGQYITGQINEWWIPCLACGKEFYPGWTLRRVVDGKEVMAGMRWDDHRNENGEWLVERCLESVRYECPSCGHPHFDNARTKSEWNRLGRYVVKGDKIRDKQSFHWTAIIDFPWNRLAELYLKALNEWKTYGDHTKLVIFFQKRMAQAASESTLPGNDRTFSREVYDVKSDWADEKFRFMTVDKQQQDVYYWMIRAWSGAGPSRRIDFGKAHGDAELEKIREENKVPKNRLLIDSNYNPKGDSGVYALCARYGWLAVIGCPEDCFYINTKKGRIQRSYADPTKGDPEIGKKGQGKMFAMLIRFSASRMADRLSGLIDNGHWIEPVGDDEESEKDYARQMSAEVKKEKMIKFTRRIEKVWVKIRNDNHYWDCGKMQVLAATIVGCLPDAFAEPPKAQSQ